MSVRRDTRPRLFPVLFAVLFAVRAASAPGLAVLGLWCPWRLVAPGSEPPWPGRRDRFPCPGQARRPVPPPTG